jgi:Protein of unknown function (DUF2946)
VNEKAQDHAMDDIVKAALKKWPQVPDCYGWLALDARGDWYMRDERIQRAGPFPTVKGSRIEHAALRAFIERNYESDDRGAWFFQNGPQRVYLQLEATPWVLRLQPSGALHTHTGRVVHLQATWLDEHGRLYGDTDAGLGLVHVQDMLPASDALDAGRWPAPQTVVADELPGRFHFLRTPQA